MLGVVLSSDYISLSGAISHRGGGHDLEHCLALTTIPKGIP